ncbi:M141R [Myxoma virus]|uniref:Hemagglutinin n=1 Tax=Myxoma virus TaxID=10273 RepID=E2CZN0_9POXV|nr:m141R [Myxoma virus]AMB18473.1 m141R [Myxoma virus]WLM68595.1 M141R [Myxoma virus]WNN27022.1 M141R [Myxoma virus]
MRILSILALLSVVAYTYSARCTNTTTVSEHVNVTISCNKTGSSSKSSFHLITWKKDNTTNIAGYGPLGPTIENKDKIEYLSTGYNTSTILIKNVSVEDTGLYYCIFNSFSTEPSEEGTVQVNVTPSATTTSLQPLQLQPQPLSARSTRGHEKSTSTHVSRTSTRNVGAGSHTVETRQYEYSSSSPSSSSVWTTSSGGSRNMPSSLFKVILIIKMIFYIPNLIG